ncbi:MAG TPA: lytic murein transglycosylase B [Sulfuricella sp.]|nr:lytic murein transglycosylase B [Sulfuricella sp.]
MKIFTFRFFLALLAVTAACPAAAADIAGFADRPEVQAFIAEMREKHGFDSEVLTRAFARIKPIPAVIRTIQPPSDPSIRSWQNYRARYVEPHRIALGLRFWDEHRTALMEARARSGVPEEIIVAIIGVETIYGHLTGHYSTFAALATLAFDYPPRAPLFRRELEELLLLARETGRDPLSFKGSYAGAIGLPQFLPSSVRRYAINGSGNDHIDLSASPADAIASVANFLKEHGWVPDGPVAAEAHVDGEQFAALLDEGIKPQHKASELQAWGVVADNAPDQPAALIDLVTPQQPMEYRLGYRNFYVLTRYNHSSFYAMAVYDLGQTLRAEHEASGQ